MDTHHFLPDFIWNFDETQIALGKDDRKVVYIEGDKLPVVPLDEITEHITLLLGVSASGGHMKPLMILPLLTLPMLPEEVSSKYYITGHKSGWITTKIFTNFFIDQFVKHIMTLRREKGPGQPVLVILDNHSSRNGIDEEMFWFFYKIKFLFLPPHSSALLQPLDLSVNGQFKKILVKRFELKGKESLPEKRERLLKATSRSLSNALNEDCVLLGWEKTGLYPFNPRKAFASGMVIQDGVNDVPEPIRVVRKRGPHFESKVLKMELA